MSSREEKTVICIAIAICALFLGMYAYSNISDLEELSSTYLLTNGSRPLIGNWNAGNYNISLNELTLGVANNNYSFPVTDGQTNEVLISDGNGTLNFGILPTPGTFIFYLHNETSDIAGNYNMTVQLPYTVTQNFPFAAVVDDQILINFTTINGYPSINILPEGLTTLHIHANRTKTGTATGRLYYEIYRRNAGGTEVLLTTSMLSNILTADSMYENILATLNNATIFDLTDRITVSIRIMKEGVGTLNVELQICGDTSAHFAIPSPSISAANFVPYVGATQDVDLGAFTWESAGGNITSNNILYFRDGNSYISSENAGDIDIHVTGDLDLIVGTGRIVDIPVGYLRQLDLTARIESWGGFDILKSSYCSLSGDDATVGTPLVSPGGIRSYGKYWSGGVSNSIFSDLIYQIWSVAPASSLYFNVQGNTLLRLEGHTPIGYMYFNAIPSLPNTYDFGSGALEWKDHYLAGTIYFGTGQDVNLYRGGANVLQTDDALTLGGVLTVGGNILGWGDGGYNIGSGTADDVNTIYYHTLSQHSDRDAKTNISPFEISNIELPQVYTFNWKERTFMKNVSYVEEFENWYSQPAYDKYGNCTGEELVSFIDTKQCWKLEEVFVTASGLTYGFMADEMEDTFISEDGTSYDPIALLAKSIAKIHELEARIEYLEQFLLSPIK